MPSIRTWLSVGVGFVATVFSPILLLLGSGCGRRMDPSGGALLAPALPALAVLRGLGADSILPYCLGIGISYGLLCYCTGTLLRYLWRRVPG